MYVRILTMLSLQMGMVFFALTNTPRKILAFDLLKALSANLHSLRSQCYKTAAIRNQAASRAGSRRADRTEQTLGILLLQSGWTTGLATEKQMWRVEDDPLE